MNVEVDGKIVREKLEDGGINFSFFNIRDSIFVTNFAN